MDRALKIVGIILFVVAIGIILVFGTKTHESYETISQEDAYKMMEEDVVILDVRTNEEYQEGHIENAINIPLDEITDDIDLDEDKKILIYCQSGNRSKEASSKLYSLGYDVYNFGGISNWPYEVVR